jgi:hypothetical protein
MQTRVKVCRLFYILVSICLIGCGSVPLSSMLKINSLGAQGLQNVIPRQVRTRITITEPASLQHKDVKLVLKFEFAGDKPTQYQFDLNLLRSTKLAEKTGFFSSEPAKNQYIFQLSEPSRKAFRRMQNEFYQYGKPDKYFWTVYYYLAERPKASGDIEIDLELKLSMESDYFYLLKQAAISPD